MNENLGKLVVEQFLDLCLIFGFVRNNYGNGEFSNFIVLKALFYEKKKSDPTE